MDPMTAVDQMRILVGYDGRMPARQALEAAVEMSGRVNGRLLLLNVMQGAVGAGGEYVCSLERLDEREHREAERMLLQARNRLPGGIESEQMVRTGEPCEQILSTAREWRADLIIIGVRGRGRFSQFLLGCTVEEVMRRAECPVMTVGPRATVGSAAQGAQCADAAAAVVVVM